MPVHMKETVSLKLRPRVSPDEKQASEYKHAVRASTATNHHTKKLKSVEPCSPTLGRPLHVAILGTGHPRFSAKIPKIEHHDKKYVSVQMGTLGFSSRHIYKKNMNSAIRQETLSNIIRLAAHP